MDKIKKGNNATKVALIGNTILTILNITMGIYSGSHALLSEGLHTFSDICVTITSHIGFKIGSKPADKEHPLGHGRAEAIVGLVITIILFIISFQIIHETLEIIIFNKPYTHPNSIAIIVAIIGIIINSFISHYLIKVGKKINSPSIYANGKHQKADVISSIGILIGVMLSIMGYPIWDLIISIIIGILILKIGIELLIININNIMGKIPSHDLIDEIRETTLEIDEVYSANNIEMNYFGNYAIVCLEIELDSELSFKESYKISNKVKEKILEKNTIINKVTIQTKPIDK